MTILNHYSFYSYEAFQPNFFYMFPMTDVLTKLPIGILNVKFKLFFTKIETCLKQDPIGMKVFFKTGPYRDESFP